MFPETRTGMAAKDTLRRDYTIRKKLISSNEKLRVSHKLYRMHEKAEYSLCLFVYNSMEIDDDYNNGIFIEKLNLNSDEVIYIGDAYSDYQAALNANIDFGLAKWGSVACQDIPSQYTFENPIDLLKLL